MSFYDISYSSGDQPVAARFFRKIRVTRGRSPFLFVRLEPLRKFSSPRRGLLREHKNPLLVGDDNIGELVAVDVRHDELRPDDGGTIDLVGKELHRTVFVALGFEPVEDGRVVGSRVAAGSVRPKALAGNQVPQPVAIDIDEVQRMRFGKE